MLRDLRSVCSVIHVSCCVICALWFTLRLKYIVFNASFFVRYVLCLCSVFRLLCVTCCVSELRVCVLCCVFVFRSLCFVCRATCFVFRVPCYVSCFVLCNKCIVILAAFVFCPQSDHAFNLHHLNHISKVVQQHITKWIN